MAEGRIESLASAIFRRGCHANQRLGAHSLPENPATMALSPAPIHCTMRRRAMAERNRRNTWPPPPVSVWRRRGESFMTGVHRPLCHSDSIGAYYSDSIGASYSDSIGASYSHHAVWIHHNIAKSSDLGLCPFIITSAQLHPQKNYFKQHQEGNEKFNNFSQ